MIEKFTPDDPQDSTMSEFRAIAFQRPKCADLAHENRQVKVRVAIIVKASLTKPLCKLSRFRCHWCTQTWLDLGSLTPAKLVLAPSIQAYILANQRLACSNCTDRAHYGCNQRGRTKSLNLHYFPIFSGQNCYSRKIHFDNFYFFKVFQFHLFRPR